jgi:hypothetical protein
MKSSFQSLIPFFTTALSILVTISSQSFNCRLKRLSELFSWEGGGQQKTPFPNNSFIVIQACLPRRCIETAVLYCCLRVHFRGNLFTEPLPSNELLQLSGVMSQY